MKQQNAPMRLLCCVSVVGLSLAGCSQKATNVKPTIPPQASFQTAPPATADAASSRLFHYSKKGLRQVKVNDTRTTKRVQYEYANLWDRLFDSYALPDVRNSAVEREVSWYVNHPTYLQRAQQRAEPFLYNIVQQIERQEVPGEIALLPVVESAFQPQAVSPAKAAGIWQFIPATGRHYGLRQNHAYDGRRDVYASTRAAIKYLKKLNRQFNGDWLLAIAAYNCGEGAVERAIRRNTYAGLPTDFWSLDLPQETRSYVPRLLAVSRLMADADHYGVDLIHIPNQARYKPVKVTQTLDLAMAADAADMSLEQFKALNPGFKNSFVDPEGSVRLFVPADKSKTFKKELARLASVQSDLLNREFERVQATAETITSSSSEPAVVVPAAYRPPTPRRPVPNAFEPETASESVAMVSPETTPARTTPSYDEGTTTANPFRRSLAAEEPDLDFAAPQEARRKAHHRPHFGSVESHDGAARHVSRGHQDQKKNDRAGSAKSLEGSERATVSSGRHGKTIVASRQSDSSTARRASGDRKSTAKSATDGRSGRSNGKLTVAMATSSGTSRNSAQSARIKTREASVVAVAPSGRTGARSSGGKSVESRKAERIVTAKADVAKTRTRR
jgi:membrane-bound lytic murein transglycosylase D